MDGDTKKLMEDSIAHLKKELAALRSGRANPAMLDGVKVDVYGTSMRLRDIANITTPEPRQLLITLYDASNVSAVKKGIENSNLGLQPIVDGSVIRLNVPELNEERRREIVKQCKQEGEKTKITIREIRKKTNDTLKKQKSEMAEDAYRKMLEKIDKLTTNACQEVDKICFEKEQEILKI